MLLRNAHLPYMAWFDGLHVSCCQTGPKVGCRLLCHWRCDCWIGRSTLQNLKRVNSQRWNTFIRLYQCCNLCWAYLPSQLFRCRFSYQNRQNFGQFTIISERCMPEIDTFKERRLRNTHTTLNSNHEIIREVSSVWLISFYALFFFHLLTHGHFQ